MKKKKTIEKQTVKGMIGWREKKVPWIFVAKWSRKRDLHSIIDIYMSVCQALGFCLCIWNVLYRRKLRP